jgi:hypothetical protein
MSQDAWLKPRITSLLTVWGICANTKRHFTYPRKSLTISSEWPRRRYVQWGRDRSRTIYISGSDHPLLKNYFQDEGCRVTWTRSSSSAFNVSILRCALNSCSSSRRTCETQIRGNDFRFPKRGTIQRLKHRKTAFQCIKAFRCIYAFGGINAFGCIYAFGCIHAFGCIYAFRCIYA